MIPNPESCLRVVITGASGGLGLALAQHYLEQGAAVMAVSRRAELLQSLSEKFPELVYCYPLDVRDAAAMQAAAQDFIARVGVPDIVIANAGVSVGTLTEYAEDLDAFQQVMDINVLGMVKTFQPFVAAMREAGHGTLVGIASVAGFRGLPGAGAYSASKAAAISYLESLRVELHGSGVKVVTICPSSWMPKKRQSGWPSPSNGKLCMPSFRGKWGCLGACLNYCHAGCMTGYLPMRRTSRASISLWKVITFCAA